MNSARRWRAAVVVGATALVMSACGGGGDSSGEDAADGEPVTGGAVSIIQMSEPRLLDPAVMQNSYVTSTLVGNGLFGTLLTDKPDGTFDYGLAESLESTDGGTTWELTLRDDITFSDGSPLDAEDVAFNWERIKDPELGSTTRAAALYVDDLEPDGKVLTFTLTEPVANFPFAVARESMNWIAKPEALEAGQAEFDKNPIGAGPFVLESWARGGKMVLKKNPEYYDAPRPYLDELVLTANGDEGQRFSTVESGGADATMSNSAAHFNRGVDNGLKGLTQGLGGGISMYLNTRIAPFDDARAREAVAKGIDLEAVNAAAYDGEGVVPKTLFSEQSPFYSDTPLTSYDKDAAQKLFDELADEGKPVEFMITAYQTSESKRVAEAFQAGFSAYENVEVQVEVLDFPAATAKVNGREFQMAPGGVGFSDPEMAVYQNLHSDSASNYSGIDDAELDEALERGRATADPAERKTAYADLAARYSELNPVIHYMSYVAGIAHDSQVAGFVQYGFGSTRVDEVWTTKK